MEVSKAHTTNDAANVGSEGTMMDPPLPFHLQPPHPPPPPALNSIPDPSQQPLLALPSYSIDDPAPAQDALRAFIGVDNAMGL
jgi:hypothetical protein